MRDVVLDRLAAGLEVDAANLGERRVGVGDGLCCVLRALVVRARLGGDVSGFVHPDQLVEVTAVAVGG